jgi:hypothetical protein
MVSGVGGPGRRGGAGPLNRREAAAAARASPQLPALRPESRSGPGWGLGGPRTLASRAVLEG